MPVRPKLLALAALVSAGCATAPTGQPIGMRMPTSLAEPVPRFERQGEIQFTPAGTAGLSAAWDARSVRGPAVNLTLTDQGLWGGSVRDRAVLLRARSGRITGESVDFFVTQEGPFVHVQGIWFGSLVRLDLGPGTISASPTTGACGIELALAPDGLWRGFGGCGGTLNYVWMALKGVAADPAAEMPQWLFAFLAALPSPQVSTFGAGGTFAVASAGGGLGTFLPAEFRGPAVWNPPPLPCSAWDQRLCGPFGYDFGTWNDIRRGGGSRPPAEYRAARPQGQRTASGTAVSHGGGAAKTHVSRTAEAH